METTREQLKTMNQQYHLYLKNKTAFNNNLIALLDQSYPGVNAYFKSHVREDGSQKCMDFATSFWHVDCVRSPSAKAFLGRYQKWCKRHGYQFSATKAGAIYQEAKKLVPGVPKNEGTKELVAEAIRQLNAIARTVEVLRNEMRRLAQTLPEPCGDVHVQYWALTGPQLIAQIGDIRRFKQRGSLTAFAGLDSMPSQSGTRERLSTPSSKRGSLYLRKTLIQNAPPEDKVSQFLDKRRSEGKLHYVYMTATANKFLRIYYGHVVLGHFGALASPHNLPFSAPACASRVEAYFLSIPLPAFFSLFCLTFYSQA